MAEKRVYVAAAGLLLAAGSALAEPLASRRSARTLATLAVVALLVMTYRRNTLWANPMDVWEEAVQRAPAAWQAHLGYGDLLREIHRCDRAQTEYEQVLRLYPNQPDAMAGLAACR
jgi:Flp pilus assembly protein TadD